MGMSGKSIPDAGSSMCKGPFCHSVNKHLLGPTRAGQVLRARHTEPDEIIPNSEDFRAQWGRKERPGH